MKLQNGILNTIKKKNLYIILILSLVSFILIFLYIKLQKISYLPFDSGDYWNLSFKFIGENGSFSFANFSDDRRGYMFPFIIYCLRIFADFLKVNNITFLNIINPIMFVLLTCIIIPIYFERIFNLKFNIISRILIIIIIFYFWRGSFAYPLSDFPSILFVLVSIILIKKIYETSSFRKQLINSFFSGVFIYIGYNIRPIYLILILAEIIFLAIYKKIKFKIRIILIACLLIGVIITAIPQILINVHTSDSFNPLVESSWQDQSLYLYNLKEGLLTQKYLTNINTDIYPSNKVVFIDKQGILIANTNINSYSDYLKVILKNPLTTASIYFRHLFNGISVYYPDIYVKNIFQNRTLFLFFNYTLWFIFLFALFKGLLHLSSETPDSKFMIYCLVIPIIFTIPLQAVSRFYLPLFILCYGFICSLISQISLGYKKSLSLKNNFYKAINNIKRLKKVKYLPILKTLLLYSIFLITCFVLSSYTFMSLAL